MTKEKIREYRDDIVRFAEDLYYLGLTPKTRIQLGLDKEHRKDFAQMIVESQETENDTE